MVTATGPTSTCEDRSVEYVTRIERFTIGDFPKVCVYSGRPATKLVPVEAMRTSTWPWFLLPISFISFVITKTMNERDTVWGQLPFAEGQVQGITAKYDPSIGVILRGVHPDFVEATRAAQGRG